MATLYSAVQATPDASETEEGKLRIATNAEGLAGTDDTTAMTPLKVANAIAAGSGSVTGALVYRGAYDASLQTPDLTTASKGDFYLVSVGGSVDGVVFNVGDHLVFNQNASSPITSAMFDKIDSTDAVSSVNTQTGAVVLTASDVGAIATGSNVSALTNDAGYITSTLSASLTADTDRAYNIGSESTRIDKIYADLDGAVCFKGSNASGGALTKGQAVYISGLSGDVPEVSLADADSSSMPAAGLVAANANAGAEVRIITFGNLIDVDTSSFSLGDTLYIDTTAGALTATPPAGETALLQNIGKVIRAHASSGIIKVGGAGRSAVTPNLNQDKIFLGDSNNRAVSTALSSVDLSSFNNDLGLATVATTGAYSDLSGTPTLGTASALDVGTSASNVIQLDGSARLPAVDGSQLTNLPSASAASETTAGVIEIATDGEATAASDGDKALVPSNIGAIALSSFNDDLSYQPLDAGLTSISGLTTAADKMIYTTASDTYAVTDLTTAGRALLDDADAAAQRTTLGLGTAATSASSDFLASTAAIDDLSDVSISSPSNAQVLSYNSTSGEWENATSPSGATTLGGLSDVTITAAAAGEYLRYSGASWVDAPLNIADDATPSLGGDLDLNGNHLVTTSNDNINLVPDGTGVVVLRGNQTGGNHPGALKFNCELNQHGVTIQGPAHSATGTYTLTLPAALGSNGQFLKTDASGVLSWASGATSAAPTAQNTTATLSTPTATEEIYTIDSSSLVTLTMADSSNCGAGFKYRFKRLGTGAVNITCASGDGIDHSGQTTFAISDQYDSITLVADGANLFYLV